MKRLPALHWPSIRGRAIADAGPLVLVAVVVAVASLLAGVVAPLLRATADEAVQQAVRHAGGDADILVNAPWEPDSGLTGRIRAAHLAADTDEFVDRATRTLDPELRAVLQSPIATVTSISLKITTASTPLTFQLTYLTNLHGGTRSPNVTWIAGGPPQPAVPAADSELEVPYDAPAWPVQVGLSEADADALALHTGSVIPLKDGQNQVKNVTVSGIFRPADSTDPAWRLAPWLLHPVPGADGEATTRLGGLLTPESLPDARLAFNDDDLTRTVWFSPNPQLLTWDSAQAVAAIVKTLKASAGSSSGADSALKWETRLDDVLRDVRKQVDAAAAQASVLLTGVVTAVVLVLLLAGDLVVRRRAAALGAARYRGASLPDLGSELLLESTAVVLVAAGAGLALARTVGPGISWGWVAPVVLCAATAGPAFGLVAAARTTRDRRAPANRTGRQRVARIGRLRRVALGAAVLIAATAAFVALYQRGVLPDPAGDAVSSAGPTAPASAPTLGVLAGALLLLQLLPPATQLALRQSLRSRRRLAVFGAARAVATSRHVLPVLAMVTAAALASFALILGTTVHKGLIDGAWRTVGADARVDVAPGDAASTTALADRIAAEPGVRQAVAAQVTDGTRFAVESAPVSPRLVIVDAIAFQRLLAGNPLPDAPTLDRLGTTGSGDIPALVRSSDGRLRPGVRLELLRDGAPAIRLVAVGLAPAVDDVDDVVLLDTAAATAAGLPVVPNTVWVTGPGAAQAANAIPTRHTTVVRADLERERETAPLTARTLRLAWSSAATLLALGLLGLALGAVAGAPERWHTLTRLRTLGLRTRDARLVAAGEVLPPVLLAALGGPLLGILVAQLALGRLGLRLLTGQTEEPTTVVPWWALGVVAAVYLATVAVVIPIESALRRRQRLSDVLRAGEGPGA